MIRRLPGAQLALECPSVSGSDLSIGHRLLFLIRIPNYFVFLYQEAMSVTGFRQTYQPLSYGSYLKLMSVGKGLLSRIFLLDYLLLSFFLQQNHRSSFKSFENNLFLTIQSKSPTRSSYLTLYCLHKRVYPESSYLPVSPLSPLQQFTFVQSTPRLFIRIFFLVILEAITFSCSLPLHFKLTLAWFSLKSILFSDFLLHESDLFPVVNPKFSRNVYFKAFRFHLPEIS